MERRIEWQHLYKSARWRRLREAAIVAAGGCCEWCGVFLTVGNRSDRSAAVHHRTAHKGDLFLFHDPDNLIVTCRRCHNTVGGDHDRLGYSTAVGPDGFPTDPRHPFNRPAATARPPTPGTPGGHLHPGAPSTPHRRPNGILSGTDNSGLGLSQTSPRSDESE
jgi:hypothetical protein